MKGSWIDDVPGSEVVRVLLPLQATSRLQGAALLPNADLAIPPPLPQ